MNTDFPNRKSKIKSFDLKVYSALERILRLVCDMSLVNHGFITINNNAIHEIRVEVGFEGLLNPNDIRGFNQVISKNEVVIISGSKKDIATDSIYSDYPFDSFAGFPFYTIEGVLLGTLCVLDKDLRVFSTNQLKIIKESVLQIESLLQLYLENIKLKEIINNSSKKIFELSNVDESLTFETRKQILEKEPKNSLKKSIIKKYSQISVVELSSLVNELKVYQTELEMQNEKIIVSKESSEITAQKYRELYDFAPIGFFTLSKEGRIEEGNYTLAKIVGKERSQLINNQFAFYISEDSKTTYNIFLEKIFTSTIEQTCEVVMLSDKNERISVLLTGVLSSNKNQYFIAVVDLTENKDKQSELAESRQLIASVTQNIAVGILVQGSQSEIVEYNGLLLEMLRVTEDQLLGETPLEELCDVVHLDGSHFKSEDYPLEQAKKTLMPVHNIIMGVSDHVKNDEIWLLVNAVPVFGNLGELIYIVCSFSNITTLKNMRDTLEISNKRFAYSNLASSEVVTDWDFISGKVFVGDSFMKQFGHNVKNNIISYSKWKSFVHPTDNSSAFMVMKEDVSGESNKWSHEFRYLKADGIYAHVEVKAIIIRDEVGKVIRLIGAMKDISCEKVLKGKLIESEAQFKATFEYSSFGIAIVDREGKTILINNRLVKMLGYSVEENKKVDLLDIIHPDDRENGIAKFVQKLSGAILNYSIEKRFIHKDGSIVWVDLSVSVVKNEKGEPIHFVYQFMDTTRKKEIEAENKALIEQNNNNKTIQLNEAKGLYRLLADNTEDLVCLHDMNSKFKYVSPSIKRILGYDPEELIGLSPLQFVHPKDLDKLQKEILDFIDKKNVKIIKLRFKNKKNLYVWCECKLKFVLEKGVPVHFQTFTRDITREREARIATRKAINKEQELNKLHINLASTISHELRTPLTTILSNTDLIEMYLQSKKISNVSFIDERIRVIRGEIERIISLMDNLLVLSKNDLQKTNFNAVVFDLKQFCLKIIKEGNYEKSKRRNVRVSFKGDTFPVSADAKLMEYIFINLLKNAFKYSQGNEDVFLNLFIRGKVIFIQIIDFGIGIPKAEQKNVFNFFFRASNTTGIKGTGLGLYIAKIFTETNSGCINLESTLGEGTKVTLRFPLAK
jgi:PAS domain S-box-containing protein